jgi:hypothetical protein
MSVGNNITDASRDLIISVGHNIAYLSMNYYTSVYTFLKIHPENIEEGNDSNSINSAKDINDNNNYKESEIKIQNGQTNYQLETSNYEFTDPVCLFDLQVSPNNITYLSIKYYPD